MGTTRCPVLIRAASAGRMGTSQLDRMRARESVRKPTAVIDIFERLRLYSGCSCLFSPGQPLTTVAFGFLGGKTVTDRSTPALIFGVSRLSMIAASLSIPESPVAQRLARETVDPSEFRFADPSPDVLHRRGGGFEEWHTSACYAG
jgi:hypothetical protein